MNQCFIASQAAMYADPVRGRGIALANCVGFIDGTALGIAKPKEHSTQHVIYNDHKRKHALKFQAGSTPDENIQHIYGAAAGRRHDWTLYLRSELDNVLPLNVSGSRYCLYGDSGYNQRWYMEVLFQGSNLTLTPKAFNKAMSSTRITRSGCSRR